MEDADYRVDYFPAGTQAELPHQSPGTTVPLAVRVVDRRGRPAVGVVVHWSDGRVMPNLRPVDARTDTNGVARTVWALAPLLPDQFRVMRSVKAYLPGAENNPISYRIEVVACTRC